MLKTVVRGGNVCSMQLRWKHVFGAIKLKAAYFRNQKAKTLFCEILLTIAQFNCKQIKVCFLVWPMSFKEPQGQVAFWLGRLQYD